MLDEGGILNLTLNEVFKESLYGRSTFEPQLEGSEWHGYLGRGILERMASCKRLEKGNAWHAQKLGRIVCWNLVSRGDAWGKEIAGA